jgi:xanthine phosphoribosyltransferase
MAMQELVERIRAEGKNLGNGILKIDSLLNHQLDPLLMHRMGQHMAEQFEHLDVQRIVTAEISGIAPALMTGIALNVPVVYARKKKPITMAGPIYIETAPSHTKGGEVSLMVSGEFLQAGERVLIIDDFLASGQTLMALARLVVSSGAELIGVGVVVEKSFENGRQAMQEAGFDVPTYALATISALEGKTITFAE